MLACIFHAWYDENIDKRIVGLPESAVYALLGPPTRVESSIDLPNGLWPESAAADLNLLYERDELNFQGLRADLKTLVVSVKNHACTHAITRPYIEQIAYQRWKANVIGRYALGKTILQIIQKLGFGYKRYETGESTCVRLEMKNGRCINYNVLAIWH